MYFYTRALSYAKKNSLYEALAFANRGISFYNMEMYQESLNDLEFAIQRNIPNEFLPEAKNLLFECQQLTKRLSNPNAYVPKIELPRNDKFTRLAKSLTIKYNEEFGRFIAAKLF